MQHYVTHKVDYRHSQQWEHSKWMFIPS